MLVGFLFVKFNVDLHYMCYAICGDSWSHKLLFLSKVFLIFNKINLIEFFS